MIVTVGGQAASGKTTLAVALARRLGFKHISAGEVMRDLALERGMSIVEFSAYAETHPEVDRLIDERQRMLAVGDCVVDGRLSRYFLNPDISIWLVASADVRARRLIGRGERYSSFEDARRDLDARDASERRRYMEFYSIDLADLSVYDLVINTGRFDVDQMISMSLAAVDILKR